MRHFLPYFGLLVCVCVPSWGGAVPARQQDPQAEKADAPRADFFSGTVTALDNDRITVTRKGLGKDQVTRTFLIDASTKVEGKPKVRSRVNVNFVTTENGDRAVHIIARP